MILKIWPSHGFKPFSLYKGKGKEYENIGLPPEKPVIKSPLKNQLQPWTGISTLSEDYIPRIAETRTDVKVSMKGSISFLPLNCWLWAGQWEVWYHIIWPKYQVPLPRQSYPTIDSTIRNNWFKCLKIKNNGVINTLADNLIKHYGLLNVNLNLLNKR